eukprot:c10576_g1_i1 orf=1-954(-)
MAAQLRLHNSSSLQVLGMLAPIPVSHRLHFNGVHPISHSSMPIIVCSSHHRPSQLPVSNGPDEACSTSNGPDEACSTSDHPDELESPDENLQAFSRLSLVTWDLDSVVTFMVSYFSILHVPLGLGGLSLLAEQLDTNELAPQTKAISLVIFQLLELIGTTWLIQSSMKQSKRTFQCFNFDFDSASGSRGWVATAAVGLAVIVVAMGATSFITGSPHLSMPDDGKEEAIRQMLSDNIITKLSTLLVCCILTPCTEEIVYRGYLLQSMATRFGWQWAVVISSFVFTMAHFDISGAPALFFVGCVLGAAYTWSGNLITSLF